VPFCHLAFSAERPPERRYERSKVPADTLGATFRERRWSRGFEQREAAAEIGVPVATYRRWEVNQAVPTLKYLPSAIAFLGYDWRPAPRSFGESLRIRRTRLGWSLRELARRAGVDWSTIRAWECGEQRPTRRLLAAVEGALAMAA
jgi:transcriptional regulator with XRE-family HTH domain